MSTDDEGMVLARFPVGISVDLFTALGALVDAALSEAGELMLAASDAPQTAAKLTFRTELSQRQVAGALRAAAAHVDPIQAAGAAADEPEAEHGVEVGHVRHDEDTGEMVLGVGGVTAETVARELATRLAAVMLPAMDAAGARNYLAWSFIAPDSPWQQWELTIRRPDGLSPDQKQRRYEQVLQWIVAEAQPGPGGVTHTLDRDALVVVTEHTEGREPVTVTEIVARAQEALDAMAAPTKPHDTTE